MLAFAALKMLADRWLEIGPLAALAVILTLLGITIAVSLALPSNHHPELQQP